MSGMWSSIVSSLALVLVLGAIAGGEAAIVSVDEAPLLALKASIQQDPLHALDDWVDGGLCTNWSHVVCDVNNRVVKLNLQDKLLVAPAISSNLSRLSFLQDLNLQNNSFSGLIPADLGELPLLQQLRLGLNPLNGRIPFELLTLAGLFHLNIARTNVSGNLSPSVSNLINMSFLFLDNTQLSGPIPEDIGMLTKLQKLRLFQDFPGQGASRFTGPLPESLGTLTSLTELNVANNGLSGVIPDSLSKLHKLSLINVSGNQFTGEIPPGVLQLRSLKTLDISSNNFTGTISPGSIVTFRYDNNPYLQIAGPCTKSCNSSGRSKSNILVIVAILLAICLVGVVAGVLGCTWYYRRRGAATKPKHQTRTQIMIKEVNGVTPDSVNPPVHTRSFKLKEIIVATNNFNPQNVIGSGGFGLVYKGQLENNEVVAVKRAAEASQQGVKEFFTEVELLSKIHHKHLVNLVGYCADSGEQMLIYEYVPNGSLLEHLTGRRGLPLTWRQRVRVAICAANGLAYLHEGCSPPIIHRDLKPSNILLDLEDGAKVSDFGLSKEGPPAGYTHVSTSVKGTPGYLDPYYYLSYHLSTSSDVYGFGVILLQLVSAKPAVDHSRKQSQYNIINWAKDSIERGDIEAVMDSKLLEQEYNRDILLHMATLGLRCVAKDRKSRPTMTQVSQELDIVLRTYDTFAKPRDEVQPNKNIKLSPLNDEELSRDFYEQEKFYPGDSNMSLDGLQVVRDYGLDSRDAPITDSHRQSSAAESTSEVNDRTPSSSGSVYVFPLDRADSNIKFDGMPWVDIKNIDDERLHQFSGAITYEKRLQEFTGNIEISGDLATYYPKTTSTNYPVTTTMGPKFPPKSSPL